MDVGLLDHGRERLLGRAARLEEGGEVGALAQLGDGQLDPAGARVPGALAVAVAVGEAIGAAHAGRRAGQRLDLQAPSGARPQRPACSRTRSASAPFSISSIRAILSSVIVVSGSGSGLATRTLTEDRR